VQEVSDGILKFQNVSASIAGVSVLRGITTSLAHGSTVAVVGRNGAGKTTLLRIIMGFVPYSSEGSVMFDDKDLSRVLPQDRPRLGIGYAPEDRVLFPSFTVEENLRFPCEVIRLPKKTTDERLEEVLTIVPELKPMLGRSGAVLSGGQAKMAVLGRALMVGTRLVLLDEPFQGLAPVLAVQYSESLHRLHKARPDLCILITESNRSLLKDIPTMTLTLERGAMTADVK
jgi:ABC-type branched-subunit amino acid transport system ATPase component